MAVRSRSSLQVRQDPDISLLPSPKRRRVQQPVNSAPPRPPSNHRRASSPDLLDTTIGPSPPKPLSIRPANSSLSTAPPHASSRRPRLSSSNYSNHPPSPPSNNPKTPRYKYPSTSPSKTPVIKPLRESPDPLDTFSPAQAPAIPTPGTRPPAGRETRQHSRHNIESPTEEPAESAKLSRTNVRRNNNVLPEEPQPPLSAPPTSSNPNPVRERRSLRSHDTGTKLRSELAAYFPNYEQLLSLEPQKTEFLTGDTTIQLVDDLTKPPSTCLRSGPESPFGNPLVQLHNCQVIELPQPKRDRDGSGEDPLNEETYSRPHRRVERQEKQLRNIERERAQHEKLQVDRLLDELRGQDWLRVMGIAGVADNTKKLYESKRDFFVGELSSLTDKFKLWKEKEKRRKLAKDKPPSTSPEPDTADSGDIRSTEETSDPNDVDAQAARQLHREARSATSGKKPKHTSYTEKRRKSKPIPITAGQEQQQPQDPKSKQSAAQPPPQPPEMCYIPNKPFTSFFATPELRAIALGNSSSSSTSTENTRKRHHHYATLAFGNPIPDMEEREFQLPDDILTEEAILVSQRKQRRMRREGRKG